MRFGAEEFLLLLPATRLKTAQSAVDRLRAQIALHPFAAGVKLTVSAGIAGPTDKNIGNLLHHRHPFEYQPDLPGV